MSPFRLKREELISKEEDKDLADVAVDRAEAKAKANLRSNLAFVLALLIYIVVTIDPATLISRNLPSIAAFFVISVVLLTVIIIFPLNFWFHRDGNKEYENQLLELKVLVNTQKGD